MAHEELLSRIPLFEALDREDLLSLARHLRTRHVKAGEVIFRAGDPGSALFLIEDGAIEISYGEGRIKVELATIFAGQYFGELSLFDGQPRSATATAVKDSTVLALDRDRFVDFLRATPSAALTIMAEMGKRLRNTNEAMSRMVTRNVNQEADERLTFGQRIADRVAAFGGSWPFIFLFGGIMVLWIGSNALNLLGFDPFPFILLNLVLSTVAALQAPIIMMSQNRQASKDKLLAENDYRVNLKSEMEIAKILKINNEILARLDLIESRGTSRVD